MTVIDQAGADLGGWPMSNQPDRVLPLTDDVRRAWAEELPAVDTLTGAWWTRPAPVELPAPESTRDMLARIARELEREANTAAAAREWVLMTRLVVAREQLAQLV